MHSEYLARPTVYTRLKGLGPYGWAHSGAQISDVTSWPALAQVNYKPLSVPWPHPPPPWRLLPLNRGRWACQNPLLFSLRGILPNRGHPTGLRFPCENPLFLRSPLPATLLFLPLAFSSLHPLRRDRTRQPDKTPLGEVRAFPILERSPRMHGQPRGFH